VLSPKFHTYVVIGCPSVDPDASNEQSFLLREQFTANDATGADGAGLCEPPPNPVTRTSRFGEVRLIELSMPADALAMIA